MGNHENRSQNKTHRSVANESSAQDKESESTSSFADNRPEAAMQRKLKEVANQNTANDTNYTAIQLVANKALGTPISDADMGAADEATQRALRYLATSPVEFFLETPIPAAGGFVLALERKVYLLGEEHDENDSLWTERTAPWPYVPKLKEQHTVSTVSTEPDRDQEALESSELKKITTALWIQSNLKERPDDDEKRELASDLNELCEGLLDIGRKADTDFQRDLATEVFQGIPAFLNAAVYEDPGWTQWISGPRYGEERVQLMRYLTEYINKIVRITDQHSGGGDQKLSALANPGIPRNENDVLGLTNVPREEAMVRNIQAAGNGPLLVQVGNEHLARLCQRLPGAIAVPMDVNFHSLVTQPDARARSQENAQKAHELGDAQKRGFQGL